MYVILAISALCALIYNILSERLVSDCFRELTDEEKEKYLGEEGYKVEDLADKELEYLIYDLNRAGKYLFVMMILYYPAFPLLKIQHLLSWFWDSYKQLLHRH